MENSKVLVLYLSTFKCTWPHVCKQYSFAANWANTVQLCGFVTMSAKTCLVRTTSKFLFSQHYLYCSRNDSPNFQFIMVSSFGIIPLDSRKSKEIDLYRTTLKINYRRLHSQPYLPFGLVYKVGIWLTMFNMEWQIDHGLVFSQQLLEHKRMRAVLLKKWQ